MDDAQLDMGLRVDAVDCIREALKTVHLGNQDVLQAPFIYPQLCLYTGTGRTDITTGIRQGFVIIN